MDWQERNIQVARAQAALSIRSGCGVEEALVLMRRRASRNRATLDEVAQAVLDHKGRLPA